MYARIITAQVPTIQPNVVAPFPLSVLMRLKEQPGFEDALALLDREQSKVLLILVWKSKEAMEAYEASPAYQEQREQLARYFTGPATYEAYEYPFNLKQVTGVAHTSITSMSLSHPQPLDTPPADQPQQGRLKQGGSFSQAMLGRDRSHEPPPHAEELLRVIPIAQQQTRDGTTIELLSLECYDDGCILQARIRLVDPLPMTPEQHSHPHIMNFTASDDQGTRYQDYAKGGSGNQWEWRFTHAFAPALPPDARELRLELPELHWWRFNHDAPETKNRQMEAQAGPWSFRIPLQANS